MKKAGLLIGLAIVAALAASGYALAAPSAGFREVNGEIFDDWQICRTRSFGEDGFYQVSKTSFRPVIVFESLRENADLAYNLGRQFAQEYPDKVQRATKIFNFVRDRVRYATDVDQFKRDEFAQNADELVAVIYRDGIAYGDCEDTAVLLAVIYKAAGYRSAILIGPGHTAALVHLPDYGKAAVFELGGESGWLWAEATGKTNRLGWIPKEFVDARLAAYEITEEEIAPAGPIKAPVVAVAGRRGGSSSTPFPFFGIIGIFWLVRFIPGLFRRRRA